jgi:hypothetical protein
VGHVAASIARRQSEKMTRRCFYRNQNILVHLLQPLGIEAEFLGHLDQLLRGFRILDGLGELLGSVGLVSIVVGLGHRSTILDECGWTPKKFDLRHATGRGGMRTEKSAPDRPDG